jgi:DNA-binding winged helix-turn-helix (wHTH) protein
MVYRFGHFVLNSGTRELLRDGEETHLTPKAFELLELLLANCSRALSKAELQQQIWPSTFVEETNLATLVAEIRRVLGDTAANRTFIRTVYGFGYQFVGDTASDGGGVAAEHPGRLWLTWESQQIPLMEGANIIGRAPDAAIRIDSPGISRYHARILVTSSSAALEDLGSKNGTKLNGKRITTMATLVDGDEIRIGTIVLAFLTRSRVSPTETLPAGEA